MKINHSVATLTLPLHKNYGAVLQAYALQNVIHSFGCQSKVIDIKHSVAHKNGKKLRIKHYISKYLLRKPVISEKFDLFIEAELERTRPVWNQKELDKIGSEFTTYVVGSDQVWRAEYVSRIENYFLDFVQENKLKFSYAASFGNNQINYSPNQLIRCKSLLKDFNSITVREDEGIEICRDKFNSLAAQVLDPTLLLNKNKYNELIGKYYAEQLDSHNENRFIYSYVLDTSDKKEKYLASIEESLNIPLNSCTLNYSNNDIGPIEWLKGIRDSELFVTDSYHGMVFAIIFNKQFVVLINNKRGSSRFSSLAETLGLQNRVFDENTDYPRVNDLKPIDYALINGRIKELSSKSLNVLRKMIINSEAS